MIPRLSTANFLNQFVHSINSNMQSLQRLVANAIAIKRVIPINGVASAIPKMHLNSTTPFNHLSTKSSNDEWNDAWETAWLPEDLTDKHRASWETDVNFPSTESSAVMLPEMDAETKAFVEEMNENWNERRTTTNSHQQRQQDEEEKKGIENGSSLYSLENIKKDYRLKKQRIHAGLWMKEIEKQEEAKLRDSGVGAADDIDRLLDSCSEIFDGPNTDLDYSKVSTSSEFKSKPDGWETMSKTEDGNIWEMSQREEDILLQEFDRRIAYSKFQIASFIKSHIFSRRRPIDGWKYMIEVIGPNAKKGKGSVSRIPSLSDSSTQPFKEERTATGNNFMPLKGK